MKVRGKHWLGAAACRLAVALLLAVLVGVAAPVAPLHADAGSPSPIHLAACIAPQRSGDDPAALFHASGRFDCRRPQTAWGPGNYWVRLELPPAAGISPAGVDAASRQLRFVPQWQRSLVLYTRDSAGRVAGQRLDDSDLSRLIAIGGSISLPLEERERPVTAILVRLDGATGATGLFNDPQVLAAEQSRHYELLATAIFAAFAGLGIGLFCYNMVLWLTIRERFQLTYCLSLLAMLAYVWSNSGAMAVQFPAVSHTLRLRVSYLLLAFVGALALQFITDFIERDKVPPKLRELARWSAFSCMIAGICMTVVPPAWLWYADRFYVFCFVPLPPLVVALTATAWRRRSSSVRVLVIAWAVPLAMASLRIAHALHFVEYGIVVQYSLVVGMSIEALLSSLAMSFRIKLITAERDQALSDERAARHLASVDSLTGLLNRRALLEQVIAWESPEPLRLLLVDIDRFKLINDRHGHLVGDEVLREVAEVLAMRTDLRGSVARLGGEEFALIGTSDELPEGLALAILSDMRARPMAGAVSLTVSIGMAEGLVRCEDEWRELYRRADAALYLAKEEGRNRAVHAGPDCAVDLPGIRVSAA